MNGLPCHLAIRVSRPTFDELTASFTEAGYPHICGPDVIECHGVAILADPRPSPGQTTPAASPGRDSRGSSGD